MQPIQFANPNQVGLGAVPPEGPMAVAFSVDFSQASTYSMDLTGQQFAGRISIFQTLYVDNSLNSTPVSIQAATTNQTLQVPPFSFAYLPVICTNKLAVTVSSPSGAIIPMQALNIAMNPYVWSVGGGGSVVGGKLQVSDPLMDALIAGGALSTLQYNRAGDGATNIPNAAGTRVISGVFNTTARQVLITGAPGWTLTSLRVMLDPNSTDATAGLVTVTADESTTGNLFSGAVFIPTTAVTGLTGPITLIDINGAQITSKTATSTLGLTASAALASGNFRYIAQYGLSTFVGG